MEWENSTLEWRQWPCPENYHVPSTISWQQLFNDWNQVYNYEYANGQNSINMENIRRDLWITFLLPPAGRYQWNTMWQKGTDISYWSSSEVAVDRNTAHWFYVWQYGTQPTWTDSNAGNIWDFKNRARPVRCFKNDNSSYLWNIIDLDGWTWGIITIVDWKVKAFKKPTKGKEQFDGWYTNDEYSWEPIDEVWDIVPEWTNLYAKWTCSEWQVDDGGICVEW
jgi:uncharacterized protein (TIGR02145 family)